MSDETCKIMHTHAFRFSVGGIMPAVVLETSLQMCNSPGSLPILIPNIKKHHAAKPDPSRPFCTPLSSPRSTQPNLLGASLTSNIVLSSSPRILSSLNILLSTRASSPSTSNRALGVTASSTKWLSQCGQYSSDSSNSWASLRKAFLHFLQAKVYGSCV